MHLATRTAHIKHTIHTNTVPHHAGESEPPKTTGSAGTGIKVILFDRQDNRQDNNNNDNVPKEKKIKK